MCGECSQCLGHTGFAPAHGVCAFPVYTAQAPGCSSAELSKAGPGLYAFPRSKLLRFRFLGTPQRHRLRWVCVLCPSQVQAAQVTRCLETALSQVCGVSYHLHDPSHLVSWVHSENAVSGVLCVSSGELIYDCDPPVNHPGSQEDLVSNWEPAWWQAASWWCMPSLGPSPSSSGCRPPASLPSARGEAGRQLASSPLVFAQSFVCEQDWQCLRLELFVGKSSLSLFSSLWLFHSLGCYLMLGPQIVLRAFRPSP